MAVADRDEDSQDFGVSIHPSTHLSFLTGVGGYTVFSVLMSVEINQLMQGVNTQPMTGVFNQPSFSHLQRPHHPNILRTGLISMGVGPISQIYLWHGAVDPRAAIREAEASYNRILRSIAQRDTGATRDELARLHYYLAIGTPFRRGSAAIAELVTEAVARSVGFQLRYPNRSQVVLELERQIGLLSDRHQITLRFQIPGGPVLRETREITNSLIRNYAQMYGSTARPLEGRTVLDEFAHGSQSVEEFVMSYRALVTLERLPMTAEAPEAQNFSIGVPESQIISIVNAAHAGVGIGSR